MEAVKVEQVYSDEAGMLGSKRELTTVDSEMGRVCRREAKIKSNVRGK